MICETCHGQRMINGLPCGQCGGCGFDHCCTPDAMPDVASQPPPDKSSGIVWTAWAFANWAHGSINQRRKYTNRPYIEHPMRVAAIVQTVTHTSDMVAAALLHDTIEDVPCVTDEMIRFEFGHDIADLVYWLTDVSKPSDGNRAKRKQMDLDHIAKAPAAAKTIKLADIIDNTRNIKEHDPDFWRVYRHEKMRLLEVLKDGDQTLWARAAAQCES